MAGINGGIQSQLDGKLSSNLGISNANKVLLSDASGNITAISGDEGNVLTTDENGQAVWDTINTGTQSFNVASGADISAGDIVQYVNGEIIKGVGGVSSEMVVNTATTFFGYTCNDISATPLDDQTFVIAFQDTHQDQQGTVVIGKLSNGTITYGNPYTWSTQISGIEIDTLDSERVVIVYRSIDGTNIGNAIIGKVSDTSIAFGEPYTFYQSCSDEMDVTTITEKRFVIAYQDTANSNYAMAIVGTSFGTSISFGLPYTVNDAATSSISTSAVGGYTFVVAYEDGDSMGKAVFGEIVDNDMSEFVEFQGIPTIGGFDCEVFVIDGEYYIAIANAADDINWSNVVVPSSIYKWNGHAFSLFQTFTTYGNNGWKFFVINKEKYLIVCNYRNNSTRNIDSYLYKWDGNSFVHIQSIANKGVNNFEFFNIDNNYYIIASNQYDDTTVNINFKIYKWINTSFVEFQTIPANGADDSSFFTIDGGYYLALANSNNGSTRNINSYIYKWNGINFFQYQSISTNNANDFEFFSIKNDYYLSVANSYNDTSYNINSVIYKWNGSLFTEFQSILTHSATSWNYFKINDKSYLSVTNANNGSTVNIDSKIYRWNGLTFEEYQAIQTHNARNTELLTIEDDTFLVLTNHYNEITTHINSIIYRWNGSKNAITFSNEITFNPAPTSHIKTASFKDNRIYIAYQDQGDSNKGKAICGIITETNLSFGNEYTFNTSQTERISLSAIDETSLLLGYASTDDAFTGKALIAKSSDMSLSFGVPYTFHTTSTDHICVNSSGSSHALLSYQDTDNGAHGKAVSIDFTPIYPIGIALKDTGSGQEAKIAVSGVIDNLSGLSPGVKYYADDYGSLVPYTTNRFIGIALSEQKLLIQTDSPGAINSQNVLSVPEQTSVSIYGTSIEENSSNIASLQTMVDDALVVNFSSVTSSTSLTSSHREIILVSGNTTITLGDPAKLTGKKYTIKKIDSSASTVTLSGTVDDMVNPQLINKHAFISIVSDGASWFMVAEYLIEP